MTYYHAISLAVVLGVAVGTALAYLFRSDTPQDNHSNQYQYKARTNRSSYSGPSHSYRPRNQGCTEGADTLPSRRRQNDTPSCAICLEELMSSVIRTLSCGHVFHVDCIMSWRKSGAMTCPSCRQYM